MSQLPSLALQLGQMLSLADLENTIGHIRNLYVPQLKIVCKSLTLPTKGKRQDHIERLEQHIRHCYETGQSFRLLALRTIVLKIVNNDLIPNFDNLYGALQSGLIDHNLMADQLNHLQHQASRIQGRPRMNGASIAASAAIANNTAARISYAPNSTPYSPHHNGPMLLFHSTIFYTLRKMLRRFPYVIPASKGRNLCNITVSLDDAETALLQSDTHKRLYLFSGLLTAPDPSHADIQFPPIEIHVDGINTKQYVKGLKGKAGTCRPADVTEFVKNPRGFTVNIVYSDAAEPYLLYVYMVDVRSPEEIVKIISENERHISADYTRESIVKDYQQNEDDDIVMATSSLTLRCPLTYARMAVPMRSVECDHIQCFDGFSFLTMQERIPSWICPVCSRKLNPHRLAVSDYIKEILDSTSSEIDTVNLNTDGLWEPVNEDADKNDRSSSHQPATSAKTETPQVEEAIEIISLDSDSEDEQPDITMRSTVEQSNEPEQSSLPSSNNQSVINSTPPKNDANGRNETIVEQSGDETEEEDIRRNRSAQPRLNVDNTTDLSIMEIEEVSTPSRSAPSQTQLPSFTSVVNPGLVGSSASSVSLNHNAEATSSTETPRQVGQSENQSQRNSVSSDDTPIQHYLRRPREITDDTPLQNLVRRPRAVIDAQDDLSNDSSRANSIPPGEISKSPVEIASVAGVTTSTPPTQEQSRSTEVILLPKPGLLSNTNPPTTGNQSVTTLPLIPMMARSGSIPSVPSSVPQSPEISNIPHLPGQSVGFPHSNGRPHQGPISSSTNSDVSRIPPTALPRVIASTSASSTTPPTPLISSIPEKRVMSTNSSESLQGDAPRINRLKIPDDPSFSLIDNIVQTLSRPSSAGSNGISTPASNNAETSLPPLTGRLDTLHHAQNGSTVTSGNGVVAALEALRKGSSPILQPLVQPSARSLPPPRGDQYIRTVQAPHSHGPLPGHQYQYPPPSMNHPPAFFSNRPVLPQAVSQPDIYRQPSVGGVPKAVTNVPATASILTLSEILLRQNPSPDHQIRFKYYEANPSSSSSKASSVREESSAATNGQPGHGYRRLVLDSSLLINQYKNNRAGEQESDSRRITSATGAPITGQVLNRPQQVQTPSSSVVGGSPATASPQADRPPQNETHANVHREISPTEARPIQGESENTRGADIARRATTGNIPLLNTGPGLKYSRSPFEIMSQASAVEKVKGLLGIEVALNLLTSETLKSTAVSEPPQVPEHRVPVGSDRAVSHSSESGEALKSNGRDDHYASANMSHTMSPLDNRIQDMTIATPGTKRVSSLDERTWNKRLSKVGQKAKFDPREINEANIIDLDDD